MSKQNQIKDFPQNSRKVKRVVIMNLGNSIALDLYRFLISKNPYIRAKVLRNISLKFYNSFRVKLYRFFERTLSMAETILLRYEILKSIKFALNINKLSFAYLFYYIA